MTKKLTALFLTFCMMLSLLPVSAFAVSEGEASAPADSIVDTEENPNAAVDEDASDVDKDASDVDKDASDVDEDMSDVDEDASDVDEDASGAAVPGDGNAAAAPDGEEKQQDEVTADLADMAEANTTTGNGFAERLDYSKFKSGATVVKNGSTEAQGFESPTGYFAVFVYEKKGDLVYLDSPITDENALKNYTGPYTGLYPIKTLGEIAHVYLKANNMLLFDPDTMKYGEILNQEKAIAPTEYTNTKVLYPAGGDGKINASDSGTSKINYFVEMNPLGKGKWGLAVPLPSGAFDYNYEIEDVNGHKATPIEINGTQKCDTAANGSTWMPDPNNPPMGNTVTGGQSRSSMVYIPYDAEYQAVAGAPTSGPYSVDRHVQIPLELNHEGITESDKGQVKADQYESQTLGGKRGIAVYLPKGYKDGKDYKVLYISHGAQSEYIGNEWRWMNEISAGNIMDNLIYEGKAEPFIIVAIDNKVMWNKEFTTNGGYEQMYHEIMKIVEHVEGNYKVAKGAENRAYAGLSMGAITGTWLMAKYPDEFSQFALWSGGYGAVNLTTETLAKVQEAAPEILLGCGDWDYVTVKATAEKLKQAGIAYEECYAPGSHDWNVWSLLLADAAENFFFQGKKDNDLNSYESGVTVEKDETSPTGYTATFIYEEPEKYLTTTGNEEVMGNIVKVELYSDCMMLFKPDEQTTPGAIDGTKGHKPSEFAPGMYPAGGNGDTTYYAEMTSLGNGRWGLQVPLSSGAFVYNFRLTDSSGKQISRMDDPSNPTLKNTATGIRSLSSMVYVPYDAKQGTSIWADRSVEMKQADASKCGKVETIAYTGAEDTKIIANKQRGLAVYLPAGYNKNRSEPYNVLYLSHGASGDKVGNELRWMNEGAVANIMDNLVANGGIEPFVVVTMNNQDLGWDQNKIWAEQELIMKEIEARYNVSKEAKGRAFAGLSMGGITTSTIYLNHTNEFGYYGIWSAATDFQAKDALKTSNAKLMLAAGDWDFGLGGVNKFGEGLKGLGLKYQYLTVPAAHDWECWQLIFANAAQNFFFKDSTGSKPSGPSGGSSGGSGGGSGGGSSSSYNRNVSVSSTRNGSVSFSPRNPAKGATVTLTVRPNSGYVLDSIKVLDSKGVEIELTAKGNNQFTFTMPSGKITVDTQFASEGTSTPAPGFSDLSSDYWASAEISWAAEKGIMQGIRNGAFAPERTVTRQQLWMVMGRIDGSDPSDMAAACAWAKENSISDGTRPGDSLTRQQMVAILYRYAQLKGYSVTGSADTSSFPDHVNVSNYAKDAMAWAVGSGIVAGTSDGRLNPGGTATRAQFAVIMHRFCELYNMA